MGERRFVVELIKPSHYDDDGYVIQWLRSWIPSNSLACLYAHRAGRGGSGGRSAPMSRSRSTPMTSATRSSRSSASSGASRRPMAGSSAWSACSRTSFRARSTSPRQFRAAGIQVAIGGFHVSGCLAMLPELPPDIAAARDLGHRAVRRRGRGPARPGVRRRARRRAAADLQLHERPAGLAGSRSRRFCRSRSSGATARPWARFDAGRGCPFQCSFCTIINVQGRKSRWRDADDVERLVRANLAQGVYRFFITDDNFARNRNWEAIFDRLIEMREKEGLTLQLHDPGRYAVPPHPELYREGGARRLQPGLYRAGKHQPGQSAGGQEEAEPGARIPPAVSRMARAQGHHLCRLHPRLSGRHAGADRPRHRDRAATNCRSICSNSSS